ncbi:MAG: autotransporter-associated beta strand repeat-containing protein, partial [Chthoniobacterales bacterium]
TETSKATNYATYDFGSTNYVNGYLTNQAGWQQVGTGNTNGQIVVTNGFVKLTGVSTLPMSAYNNFTNAATTNALPSSNNFYYCLENFTVKNTYNSGQGVISLYSNTTASGTTYARLYVRRDGGSTVTTITNYNLGINAGGASVVYGSTAVAFNSTQKIVVAYNQLSNSVSVYVNPVGQDPSNWGTPEATQAGANVPSSGLKSFVLQQGQISSSTYNQVLISKIVVGDTVADVLPVPTAPTAQPATAVQPSGFIANWDASTGATIYYLDVANDANFTSFYPGFQNLELGTVTSQQVPGPFTVGQTLYYRVRAANSNGSSGNSTTITVPITDAPVVLSPNVSNNSSNGVVTWTNGPGWIPNIPVSSNVATVTFNGGLTGSLVASNDVIGNFVLNALSNTVTGSGSLTYVGGTFQFTTNGSTNPVLSFANNALVQTFSNNFQIDAELKVSQSGSTASNSILSGLISGVGGINKSGNGSVWITRNDNTFGGTPSISAGQLTVVSIGNGGAASSLGTNRTISLGGASATGTLRWGDSLSSGSETSDKAIVLSGTTGGGTLDVRGTNNVLTLTGNVDTGTNANARTFTLTGDGSATLTGLISGAAGLRVNGSKTRTVTLDNTNNSFGGQVTIDGNISGQSYKLAVTMIGNAGANCPLGTNGTINIGSTVSNSYNFLVWSNLSPETTDKTINMSGTAGGHALINNKGAALLKFTAPFTVSGSGAKTLYADQDNALGSTEFAGSIPDSAGGATALNKNGLGTLILSTANTFTGGVSIKGGTLRMAHVSSIAAGDIKFVTGGTGSGVLQMAYSGTNTTLGNLFLQTNATINLGTTPGASLNFGSATGWTAGAILTVSNSSIGKLYITNTNGVALDQIKSAEDPSATASLTADGLLTFTSSSTPYSTWLSYYP